MNNNDYRPTAPRIKQYVIIINYYFSSIVDNLRLLRIGNRSGNNIITR